MKKIKNKESKSKFKINKIEITEDNLCSRGGLNLFSRYLEQINLFQLLGNILGKLRKSKKGKSINSLVKQIIAYFVDGTYQSVSGFDKLRQDEGHAGLLEMEKSELAGSDIIKRFFRKFIASMYLLFRPILHKLFIWRLKIEQPSIIKLDIDTMVMDNDDALKREGVNPTYKKKKGYQN